MTGATARLADLAGRDATLAPLARLQAVALRALADDPAWREAALAVAPARADGAVLLHGAEIALPRASGRRLLDALTPDASEIDPLALIEATIAQREVEVEALASIARMEPSTLMAIGQLLARPLLLAIGERAAEREWSAGHCPVCAAWPLLAELRGIDRARILRCGRCAAAWPFRHAECVFCGNGDHRTLGYLAPERERESRRASTCERCHGYVKAVATLKPLDAEDLAFTDLVTVELDLAAIESGFGRPSAPAVELDIAIRSAE